MSNMGSNSTNSDSQFCPLLQMMRDHGVNNNTKVNMAVVCIHGLVSCLGILVNALIIWVVGFRLRQRTVASVWVLNLAISDFLATLTLPLFTVYLHSAHSWELGNPLCKAQSSIFFLNMFVSAFLLAAISLDRLLLVVKPVWSQNHRSVAGAWKVCALGWVWAALNTAPYTLFRSVIEKTDGRMLCYHDFALYSSSATLERDCNVRQGATAISKLLLAFLVPLVVIAGSYVKIGLSLRTRNMRRMQSVSKLTDTMIMSGSDKESGVKNTPTNTKTNYFQLKPLICGRSVRPEVNPLSPTTSGQSYQSQLSQSFTKMVSAVIAAFVLCWAPYHIFCTIELTSQDEEDTLKVVEFWLPLAATLAFLNPLLNPILYAFSCPHFCVRIRQSLGALFDGLVEEGEGLLMVPGKSLRAHIRRRSSRDGSLATPASPEGLCQSPDIQLPPLQPKNGKDSHIGHI